ncbi:unnamed protein product, partial [Cladocopium goreaui]
EELLASVIQIEIDVVLSLKDKGVRHLVSLHKLSARWDAARHLVTSGNSLDAGTSRLDRGWTAGRCALALDNSLYAGTTQLRLFRVAGKIIAAGLLQISRCLGHAELRTKDSDGKAIEDGMKPLLNIQKGSLALRVQDDVEDEEAFAEEDLVDYEGTEVLDVVVGKAVQSKSPKKDAGAASRKKLYFVLHNRIESDDEVHDPLAVLANDKIPAETYESAELFDSASVYATMASALEDGPISKKPPGFSTRGALRGHGNGFDEQANGVDGLPSLTQHPSAMEATRIIQVSLQQDPQDFEHASVTFCDVMMAEAADEQRDDLVDFSDDPADVTVNYALTASDAPGLAILDSGCTRTMHGSKWSSAVEDALKKYGLERQTKTKLQPFSETVSEQELGTIIDLANNTVSYKTLGIENLALIKTSRGHMAVSPCFAIPKLEATDWIFSVEGNKLQTLCNILESKDLSRTRKLQGRERPHFTQAFPAAKPWVKQLFASQYLHAFTKTWLLKTLTSQSSPIRVALRDGAVAETVRDLREDSKIHLTLVSKVIKDRVNANEQPYGSDSIEKPEMADVRALGGIWFSVGTRDRWMSGPYLVYDEPWEDYCPELQASVKRLRLQRLRDEPSDVEAEMSDFRALVGLKSQNGYVMTGAIYGASLLREILKPGIDIT